MFTPSVINMVIFILGFHGKLDAQAFEGLDIHLGKHDRGMSLAAGEFGKLLQCLTGCLVRSGSGGKSDQNLIGVQSGVVTSQIFGLQKLDRFNGCRRDHMVMTIDTGQLF